MSSTGEQRVRQLFEDNLATHQDSRDRMAESIAQAGAMLAQALSDGRRVLSCGNGGSAADAQHFAAELIGRFEKERKALPAVALSTDTSALTAIGNDYGFDRVFSRQVEGLGQDGDILLAISTSGNSPNVVQAIEAAQSRKMRVIALTGRDGGVMRDQMSENDVELRVPSDSTARIQEVHILILHCLCDLTDHLVHE